MCRVRTIAGLPAVEAIRNGEDGSVIFFQNELPYDVPSPDAWRSSPTTDGDAALKVADGVVTVVDYP